MEVCVLYYLAAINVVTFIVYGIDKLKAKKGKWRIPEASLLLLAIIGGSIGAWCLLLQMNNLHLQSSYTYQRTSFQLLYFLFSQCIEHVKHL